MKETRTDSRPPHLRSSVPATPPESARASTPRGGGWTWQRPLLALLFLTLLFTLGRIVPIGTWLVAASTRLRDAGVLGAVLFVLSYSAGAVLVVPAAMFTFVAGYTFGAWRGALIGIPGIGLSSMLIFLLSRSALRGSVQRWLLRDPRYLVLDRLVAKLGPRAVVLLRLSPLTPFSVLNYAFGLTAMRTKDYFVATCLGTLPGSFFYAQLGAVAPNLARVAEGRLPEAGRAQTYLLLVGLVLTAVIAVWLGRIAKRTLAEAEADAANSVK